MIRPRAGGVELDVLVTPRASRARFGPVHGDRVKVAVCAPPVDGEANAAVVEVVARALGVARAAVHVMSGETGRRKTIAIDGVDVARVEAAVRGET